MIELLKKLLSPLTEIGVVIAGLIAIYTKGRMDAKKAAQFDAAKKILKDVQARDKIEKDISGLSDDKLNELYDKQTRK